VNQELVLREQRDALLREAQQITSNPNATKADLKRADVLLAQASNFRSRESAQTRAALALEDATGHRVSIETNEQREERAERENTREYLRKLLSGKMTDAELRSYVPMDTTTGTPGESAGYLSPQNFFHKVTSMLAATDPLFDPSLVTYFESDNGNSIPAPLLSDEGESAVVVGENQTSSEQNITLGQLLLDRAVSWRSQKLIGSYEWIQDSAFPIDDVVAQLCAVRFRRGIGAANISTLVTQASTAKTPVAAQFANGVFLEDIANLLSSIDSDYLNDPSFRILINQSTLTTLLKEKDTQERYQSGVIHFNDSRNAYTIFGKQVAISPSVASPAASAYPVIAGPLKYWFQRVVKNSLRLLRYDNAPNLVEYGVFAWEMFLRANGGLLQLGSGSPIQVLQNPAS
jgi:HK97 family phage major capsid protein